MPSEYNFNLNPYYDDFDETKGFYRILFKPGFAVQARELTQLQTQLQSQISKFGSHVFKDGSIVLGGNTFKSNINYIKVLSTGIPANINLEGSDVVGLTSGAIGKIVKVVYVSDTLTKIHFAYSNGIVFQQNEQISIDSLYFTYINDETTYTDASSAYSIDDSVFFINNNFVFAESQNIIISEGEAATCYVGFQITESVVTSVQDTSLLDPALGSYNYSAPGADRYSIQLDLVSFDFDPSLEAEQQKLNSDFIEIARFIDGQQVTLNLLPMYSEIENTFARRTYDESGDYTVRAFNIKIVDHKYSNNSLLSIQVNPGKCYIKGYEFETVAPVYIDLPKSRDSVPENAFPSYMNYGKYFVVNSLRGDIDYTGNKTVSLYDSVVLANAAIGNCTIKFIDYSSYDGANTIYKLFVDNIVLNSNVSVSNVRSFANTTLGFQSNVSIAAYSSNVSVQGNDNSTYLVKIPKDNLKTLIVGGTSDISYESQKRFSAQSFTSNGTYAVSTVTNPSTKQSFLGSGYLSEADTRENYVVTISNNSGGGPIVGTVLSYTNGLRVKVNNSLSAEISYPGNYTFSASVIAKVVLSGVDHKSKLLQTTGSLNVASSAITNTISLLKSDCYKLTSVVAVSNTGSQIDYTSNYDLYSGQTDVLYDHGYIKLKDGYLDPVKENLANVRHMLVSFTYFTHHGTESGFCSVDSYTSSGVDYSQVPKYTASNGEVFDLNGCLDFRPRRTDGGTTIAGELLATPSSILYSDLEYYIGRIDKFIVTKERKFHVVKGIPAINPTVPTDIPDSMNLYVINVPPYTYSKEDVSFTFVENKRYTMRDIGRIEKRIEKLEYYTALTYLEKQASDESIPSDVPTIDRFKNGILVDSFAGHSVGDVINSDYRCSIDYNGKVLRPSFSAYSHTFNFSSGINHKKTGDLITLNYTSEPFITQGLVSGYVNLNPYNVFMWNGFVNLNPSSDNWIDTYSRPDLVVNLNGENDVYTVMANNVNNPASSGVRWSDWQTLVNGIPQVTNSPSSTVATTTSGFIQTTTTTALNTQTTTVKDQVARVGLDIKTGSVQTITKDLGTKIVDTSVVPFLRSRVVNFVGTGLKPSTRLYASFDGVDVNDYCFQASELMLDSITTGEVSSNVNVVQVTSKTDITGDVIHNRDDKVFVRVNNSNTSIGIVGSRSIHAGNTISLLVNGSSVGTANVVSVRELSYLMTDEQGDIAGSFLIPNSDVLKFRTGEKMFRLADVVGEGATTAAASKYIGQGLAQSTERTIVSTRVATMSINPVLDVNTLNSSTVKTTVVGQTTIAVDLTPPPPPPPPKPEKVSCGNTREYAGRQGSFTYSIDFGSAVGSCGINYNAYTVPDRYTITWNGIQYSTGFVGLSSYNTALRNLGFPNVTGPGTGVLRFNKTSAFPTTALITVDAPLTGTGWRYTVVCPEVVNVVPPPKPPPPPPAYNLEISCPPSSSRGPWGPIVGVPIDIRVRGGYSDSFSGTVTISSSNPAFIVDPVTVIVRNGTSESTGATVSIGSMMQPTTFSATVVEKNLSGTPTGLSATSSCYTEVFPRRTGLGADPVAQTFFVDSDLYPNGLFVESLDLYFRSKSPTLPVQVEIRPTVNGYPSSNDILPFGDITKASRQVLTSTDGSVATKFRFRSPVYLAPGEYSFVVRCNTNEYTIYTAKIGEFLLNDPTTRITEQPAIGSMFKSQNSSTWTPIQEEDVKFRIHKCVFATNTLGEVTLNADFPNAGDESFGLFFADGETLNYAATDIKYYFKTTNLSNVLDSAYTPYQLGTNVPLPDARHIRSGVGSDLVFKCDLSTVDKNVSPVIDLSRMSTVLVDNIINNGELVDTDFVIQDYGVGYSSNATVTITGTNTSPASAFAEYVPSTGRIKIVVTDGGSGYTGDVTAVIAGGGASIAATVVVNNEVKSNGGNAIARYITRKVTLAPGFESLDLKAYLLANIPSGTSVKVFYKVAPLTSTFFEREIWREFVVESSGTPSESGYVEYKYKTVGDNALPSNDRFKTFAIKIVMYSTTGVKVPQLRDLRVIALDD
jgi:hypothetical protein